MTAHQPMPAGAPSPSSEAEIGAATGAAQDTSLIEPLGRP